MSDITMCPGTNCPIREGCKRFTATANNHWQSYFLDPPFHINDGGFSCDMYWGDNAEKVYNSLKESVGIFIPNLNDAVDSVNEEFKGNTL